MILTLTSVEEFVYLGVLFVGDGAREGPSDQGLVCSHEGVAPACHGEVGAEAHDVLLRLRSSPSLL